MPFIVCKITIVSTCVMSTFEPTTQENIFGGRCCIKVDLDIDRWSKNPYKCVRTNTKNEVAAPTALAAGHES
jgi:hypothetical protein